MSRYPENFLWGAATSAHQVEGSNTQNDWWLWEQEGKTADPSNEACRHYTLFREDFDLAQKLNHNANRLSLEWSRLESADGQINPEELAHYKTVIKALKDRGLEPVVTIHHFTNPQWFYRLGGWAHPKAPDYFLRFVSSIIDAFKDQVRYWITINEPMVFAYHSYKLGVWPPGESNEKKMWKVVKHMVKAHRLAYDKIHQIYKARSNLTPMVGIAKNLRPFYVCPKSKNIFVHLGVFMRHRLYNLHFLNKIKDKMDFVGVNYYEGEFNSNDRKLKLPLLGGNCTHAHGHVTHENQLGWQFDPDGLLESLRWLKKYHKPVLITENGTCEEDDDWRAKFIEEHLKRIEAALQEDINVIGYLCWSLLDNFEWHFGFRPRFGLIEVDYKTFERRIKPSAKRLAQIIEDEKV